MKWVMIFSVWAAHAPIPAVTSAEFNGREACEQAARVMVDADLNQDFRQTTRPDGSFELVVVQGLDEMLHDRTTLRANCIPKGEEPSFMTRMFGR